MSSGATTPRRFHFTLRGIMILVLGVAVGCAVGRLEDAHVSDALFAALSTWAVVGLCHQIRDLRRAFHGRGDLTAAERHGWRYMAGWRCAVIGLLAGHFALQFLESRGYVVPDKETNAFLFAPGSALRTALLCLLLMTLVWSTPRIRRPSRNPTAIGSVMQALLAVAGAALGLVMWWRMQEIHFLVHVACDGISNSLRFAPSYTTVPLVDRYRPFIAHSAAAVTVALANLLVLRWLAVRWMRPALRACLTVVLVAGLAGSIAYTIWLAMVGVPRVSPWLATTFGWRSWHSLIAAGITVALVAVAVAARLARVEAVEPRKANIVWRRDAGRYYHEWRGWDLLLAAAAIVGIVGEVVSFARHLVAKDALEESLMLPLNAMYEAVVLLAIRAGFTGLRHRITDPAPELRGLSPLLFWFFFGALTITLVCLVPALAAFTFSLWLTPWYRLPGL